MKKFIEVGKVIRTHGISGAVKVQHWCDNALIFKQFKHLFFDCFGKLEKKIEFLSFFNDFLILKFFDLNSFEEAQKIVDLILYADRYDFKLPAGRVFIQDLIGSCVLNYLNEDICYGIIVDVMNYGANDIYKIKNNDGVEFLIPVIDEIVISKDLKRKLVFIKPMKGLFDV